MMLIQFSWREFVLFRCRDRAKTLEMLPQVPPRPPPGLPCGCLSRRPTGNGSGSNGELNCSTDLELVLLSYNLKLIE